MPRCKYCSIKFKQTQLNQKSCRTNDDCKLKESMAYIEKQRVLKKKKQRKEWNEEKKEKAPYLYPKKYKGLLAIECQKLARMIDNYFGHPCIDCDRPFANQQDGGHFKSKGSNSTLMWNLHNIHSQRSECNCNGIGGGRERQYYNGLVKRYGQEYAEYVDIGLQKEFKYIGINNSEISEKLAITRKLNREFDNHIEQFKDGSEAREYFNKLIGIYK